jgi:TPR repeat protein
MVRPASVAAIFGALALVPSGFAAAGPYEDAKAANDAQDYARALSLWRPLAEHGNPDAEVQVGLLYLAGHGVAQDDAEAVRWLRMAALKGQAEAQLYLGECYLNGRGVTADQAAASQWFAKSADQGNAAAEYKMGVLTRAGGDLPSVWRTAAEWFRKAADQGHVGAQVTLAVMFAQGQGVTQDNVEALKWLDIAVVRLPASETARREALDKVRAALAAKMTPAQVSDAALFAQKWTPGGN